MIYGLNGNEYFFPRHHIVIRHLLFLSAACRCWNPFQCHWNKNLRPIEQEISAVLMFVISVPVSYRSVVHMELLLIQQSSNALFELPVKTVLLSKLGVIKFFKACIARWTVPLPVCNLGGLYSNSMFLTQKWLQIFDKKVIPPFETIFSTNPYKLMKLFKKLINSSFFGWYTYPNYRPFTTSIISKKFLLFLDAFFMRVAGKVEM